jgi:hypothetical protein
VLYMLIHASQDFHHKKKVWVCIVAAWPS